MSPSLKAKPISTLTITSLVLELEQLNTKKSLQAVVLMLLMYLIDVEMRRGERSQPKLVIIDEAWDLMVRGHSSKFIEAGYRRARKLNGAFFTGTQGPETTEEFCG